MTNFEKITQDTEELTVWLDCDFCPAKKRCKKHGYTPNWNDCMKRVREWLKHEA